MKKAMLGMTLAAGLLGLGANTPATAWDRGDVDIFAVVPNLMSGEATSVEGLTVGPDGNIYVPSFGFNSHGSVSAPNSDLFVFSPNGHLVRHVTIQNSSPHELGLAFSPVIPFERGSKSLIVCDFGGSKILAVDPFTGESSVFMTASSAFPSPGFNGEAFDSKGNFYVSDSFQNIIWKTPPNGVGNNPGQVWVNSPLLGNGGGTLNPPFGANGIEFNNAGNTLYVANTAFHDIIQIPVNANGTAGMPSVLTTGINAPDGIVIDSHDNIWIAANQEDEIVVVNPNSKSNVGGVSTVVPKVIAKLGDFQGIDDDGVAHGLLFPASPAFSLDGKTLYVTDLELYLPFAGAPFSAIDSPYTLQVQRFTVSKLKAVIPPLVPNENDNQQGNDNQQ